MSRWLLHPFLQGAPSAEALPPGRGWQGGCGTLPSVGIRDAPDSVYMREAGQILEYNGQGTLRGLETSRTPTQRGHYSLYCYSSDAKCVPKAHVFKVPMGQLLGVGIEPGRDVVNGKEGDHSRGSGTSKPYPALLTFWIQHCIFLLRNLIKKNGTICHRLKNCGVNSSALHKLIASDILSQ